MDHAQRLTTRFVGALADLGLRDVAVSPGSRNTPLSLAFLAQPRIRTHTILDERSAGFFALGAAKASWLPVAAVSTSGTAAANYLPAVVEAAASRTPLLLFTADRPPELRGTGANQTIDQTKMYGSAVRLFHDVGVPDSAVADGAAALALRAWTAAADQPAAPVHLNFPFREPFPTDFAAAEPTGLSHRAGYRALPPEEVADLAGSLSGKRALVVAGGHQRPGFATASAMLLAQAGFPVIADIQCRFPSPSTIDHGDLLARAGVLDQLEPELVLRIGAMPTSKPMSDWLAVSGVEQLHLDEGEWREPLGTASVTYRADPAATVAELIGHIDPAPPDWMSSWRSVDDTAGKAFHDALELENAKAINEPVVARVTWQAAPADSILFAGSSMPIRDLDAFAGAPRADVEVFANRGASGIDGLLSAAAGAAASEGKRVIVLTGDVGALHDINALELIGRAWLTVTVVVVNNDGGGIFSFLPQADDVDRDHFDAAFSTPHGRSLVDVAAGFGIPANAASSPTDLERAMTNEGPVLVEVHTDREENVAVHQRLYDAVARALGE